MLNRKVVKVAIIGVTTAIGAVCALIKNRKKKLQKEEDELMEKIIENQKKLSEVCSDQDKMTEETIEMLDELRARLDLPNYDGIDPTTIDVSIPETEVV